MVRRSGGVGDGPDQRYHLPTPCLARTPTCLLHHQRKTAIAGECG